LIGVTRSKKAIATLLVAAGLLAGSASVTSAAIPPSEYDEPLVRKCC